MAARQAANQQRERRAKILLGVLSLVLVSVCGFWGARFLAHRKQAQPVAAPTTTASAAAGTAGAAAAQPAALTLASAPGPTQLESFSGFATRDVFKPKVSARVSAPAAPRTTSAPAPAAPTTTRAAAPAAPAAPAAKPAPTPTTPTQTVTINPTKPPAKPQGPLMPAALLKLNGTEQYVGVGAAFPKSKPTFRLTAVGRSAMWISLLHGKFAGGKVLLKVVHGHPAKLVASGHTKVSFLLALVRVTSRHVPPLPPMKPATTTVATTTAAFATTTAPTPAPLPPPTTTTAATTTSP
jgi:hypothetical protein